MTTKLIVNGEERRTTEGTSVGALLREMGYPEPLTAIPVAVAVNHNCVKRRDFDATTLCDGDEVEILGPMSGG